MQTDMQTYKITNIQQKTNKSKTNIRRDNDTCMQTNTHTHIHTQTDMHTYRNARTHADKHANIQTYTHICAHT